MQLFCSLIYTIIHWTDEQHLNINASFNFWSLRSDICCIYLFFVRERPGMNEEGKQIEAFILS